ncbi:MAG: chromate transporter [Porphyromonas sp.]|nr:chromate transporter [Porphyromonas sp.]
MIFWELIWVFSKIGIFNFGGGYAMISLIQNEVVVRHHWLTNAEFTDIVAVSQSTPGPIGINVATYVGYTSVLQAGYAPWEAVLGAVLASLSIIWLPFILMIGISHYLMKHKDSAVVSSIFLGLRPAIVGLIAAATLLLMTAENFGRPSDNIYLFTLSVALFLGTFYFTGFKKVNPILAMLVCGLLGLLFF